MSQPSPYVGNRKAGALTMPQRSSRSREKLHKNRNTTPLGVEQLEARMMNAIGSIEANIQSLLGPASVSGTQITNTAPTVSSTVRLNGSNNVVTGTTASVSVLGRDNAGEANLRYSWATTEVPTGATVTYSQNNNNSAKNTSLTFNKAGNYTVRVTIQDAQGLSTTSSLRFSVTQTLTTLQARTVTGTNVVSGTTINSTTNSQSLVVSGLDQFGNAMQTPVQLRWTVAARPTNGNATFTTEGSTTKATFTKLGTYNLRAESGSRNITVGVNVVQTVASLRFTRSDGAVVSDANPFNVEGSNLRLTVRGYDQFGTAMTTTPSVTWATSTVPTGATFSSTLANGVTTLQFSKLGSYSIRATVGSVSTTLRATVVPTLTNFKIFTLDNREINPSNAIAVATTNYRLSVRGVDQFGGAIANLGNVAWTTSTAPNSGSISTSVASGTTTLTFNRAGAYATTVQLGSVSARLSFQVSQVLTSLGLVETSGTLTTARTFSVSGTSTRLNARALDQFNQAMTTQPTISWSTVSSPTGATPTLQTSTSANVSFNRAGAYGLRASVGSASLNVTVNVAQTLTRFNVTPGTASIASGTSQQFNAQGLDQFSQAMSTQPAVTWSTSAGSITINGLLVAGATSGNFTVTARVGTLAGSANVQVTPATPANGINNRDLSALVSQATTDGTISRSEMIGILRKAGTDGSVDATEFGDLQRLVATTSTFVMPNYVKVLASNIVNGSVANRSYKGQTLGNLAAGSTATVLNNLIDKWFLGTDDPALSSSSYTYTTSTGTLFTTTPSRADARQGMLGDCYLIATLVSIADRNADAIRNMFVDNGDGTYTVRFFANGTADFVTVSRKLATYSNGNLVYSGYGLSALSAATPIWIALAEKAYAQWNETGKEGRDGTNRYAAIEGGWMGTVNAQVLGYNSTNYAFAGDNKQNLINALAANRAVTMGTLGNASAGGLYGSHAYTITGYSASTDTFQCHNPWGFAHPTPLTWAQLQANCSYFVVATPTSTSSFVSAVRATPAGVLVGNWTTIKTSDSEVAVREDNSQDFGAVESSYPMGNVVNANHAIETPMVASENETSEEKMLEGIYASIVDMLMTESAVDGLIASEFSLS